MPSLRGFTSIFIAALIVGIAVPASARPLIISTLPFDDAAQQQAIFAQLSQHLTKSLGREVTFQVGTSYDRVINDIGAGKIDVAFLGAMAYVRARKRGQVRAILKTIRHRSSNYYGVIVVKRGSELKTVKDLAGTKFAFVDKNSTAGYLYARRLLERAGLDTSKDIEPVFAGGHNKVVEMVASGGSQAGACFEGAAQMLEDPDSVVPIGRTEPIPGDPVVVRPGLGSEMVSDLRKAMIELSTLPEAKGFFDFAEIDGFVPAFDSDYDQIARMVLELRKK